MPDTNESQNGEHPEREIPRTPFRAKKHNVLFPGLRNRPEIQDKPVVFLWVGQAARPEGANASQADLLLDYVFAPLLRHSGQTFPEPTDLGDPFSVQGSVGELPRVRIGAVYRNGRRVRSFTGDVHYFPHIFLPHRNAQRQRLWMGDGQGEFLIDYRQFAPLYDYTSSWVIDVPDATTRAGEVHRLIFPWFTVAGFFFAGSSALLNLLFMSALIDGGAGGRRIFDPALSWWIPDQPGYYGVRLEKWVMDKDARVVAHLAAYPEFRRAALELSNSLARNLPGYPNCFFPVNSMRNVHLRGRPVTSRGGIRSTLVLEILTADVAEALSPRLDGVVFSRDNDSRTTPDRPLALPRGGPPIRPQTPTVEPEAEIEPIPGVRRNPQQGIAPVEIDGYYSSFADDRRIPVFKPEKETQETRSDHCTVIPCDELRDTCTISPDGEPIHGDVPGVLYTGDADHQPGELPRLGDEADRRLRSLCEAVIALAESGDYVVQWLPLDAPGLNHFEFPTPEPDAPDEARTRRWIHAGARNRSWPRRYWVCRVFNRLTERYFYLVEIERRSRGESFKGCILFDRRARSRLFDEHLDHAITLVAQCRGQWRRVRLPHPMTKCLYKHDHIKRGTNRESTTAEFVKKLERTLRKKTFRADTNEADAPVAV